MGTTLLNRNHKSLDVICKTIWREMQHADLIPCRGIEVCVVFEADNLRSMCDFLQESKTAVHLVRKDIAQLSHCAYVITQRIGIQNDSEKSVLDALTRLQSAAKANGCAFRNAFVSDPTVACLSC